MRAEDEWVDTVPTLTTGSASGSSNGTTDTSDYVASIWVPDPEARRGWREVFIDKPKPGSRPVGFKR